MTGQNLIRSAKAVCLPTAAWTASQCARLGIKPLYRWATAVELSYGWKSLIPHGSTAIQVGADNTIGSSVLRFASLVGPLGRVVAIEAMQENLDGLAYALADKNQAERMIPVCAGCADFDGEGDLFLGGNDAYGERTDWNRLRIDGSETWSNWHLVNRGRRRVRLRRVDCILAEHSINPDEVTHVCVTINGAQITALRGMSNLLTEAKHLSVSVMTNRCASWKAQSDIGYVDGRPDVDVVNEFLEGYGFRTEFRGLDHPNDQGYMFGLREITGGVYFWDSRRSLRVQ